MGSQYRKHISDALDGDFEQKIKDMMEREALDLEDENQNLLFRQVTGGEDDQAQETEENDDDEQEHGELQL